MYGSSGEAPPINVDVSSRVYQEGRNTIILVSIASKAADAGQPVQTLCSEMAHFDDIRGLQHPNGVIPQDSSMVALFDPKNKSFEEYTDGGSTVLPQSVAVAPLSMGSPSQRYCTEMEHWDDYNVEKKLNAPLMADLFGSAAPMDVDNLKITSRGVELVRLKSEVCVMRGVEMGEEYQCFCTEMLHYDDIMNTGAAPPGKPTLEMTFRQRRA